MPRTNSARAATALPEDHDPGYSKLIQELVETMPQEEIRSAVAAPVSPPIDKEPTIDDLLELFCDVLGVEDCRRT